MSYYHIIVIVVPVQYERAHLRITAKILGPQISEYCHTNTHAEYTHGITETQKTLHREIAETQDTETQATRKHNEHRNA